MNRVERGRWKLVSSKSTALNRYPGVIKRFVSPEKGRMRPLSSAAVSSRRRLVVPTATTRPPAARVRSTAAMAVASISPHFGMHHVIPGVVGLDRQEGAGADMQRDGDPRDAALPPGPPAAPA